MVDEVSDNLSPANISALVRELFQDGKNTAESLLADGRGMDTFDHQKSWKGYSKISTFLFLVVITSRPIWMYIISGQLSSCPWTLHPYRPAMSIRVCVRMYGTYVHITYVELCTVRTYIQTYCIHTYTCIIYIHTHTHIDTCYTQCRLYTPFMYF